MKKISVVTSTRADYGLLYWPIKELIKKNFDVDLIVTGTHLSLKHGHTIDAIKQDGFKIAKEIDIDIKGDRPGDICRVMGLTVSKFSDYFSEHRPDLLILLGDRYEIFSVAQAALVHNIPIAHLHGGEVTEGALDDSFRHSLTKLSYWHFTSTEEYRQRVIQLGESPDRVFKIGAPGLDNIKKLKLLNRSELEASLGTKLGQKNILVTFHPVTVDENLCKEETKNFYEALSMLDDDAHLFISMPNADAFSRYSEEAIENLAKKYPKRVHTFMSLGQLRYLSLMREVDLIAGNSSSGILEAPFLAKPVVNVGLRQKGRISSEHVIHVDGDAKAILKTFKTALSTEFKASIKEPSLLYGDGEASSRMAEIIADKMNTEKVFIKRFYDLNPS